MPRGGRRSLVEQPLHQRAVGALGLEVRQHERQRLPDHPAPVDGEAVLAAQRETGVLDVEQLVGGDVDRHLLVVSHPATGLARSGGLGVVGHGPDAALALVLADLEAQGADSALVQRLLDE